MNSKITMIFAHLKVMMTTMWTLCGDKERQKSRYATWGGSEHTYLVKHLGKPLSDSALVYRRHLLEAKQYGQRCEHIPSWKTVIECNLEPSPGSAKKCSNPQCENKDCSKLIKPMFTTNDKLAEIFQTQCADGPFVMCRQCYYKAYDIICVSQGEPCGSCGANPTSGTTFCWHIPDAITVSQHLSNTTGQSVIIKLNDYLCFSCYRTQCS